jgi:hypothetical protein
MLCFVAILLLGVALSAMMDPIDEEDWPHIQETATIPEEKPGKITKLYGGGIHGAGDGVKRSSF